MSRTPSARCRSSSPYLVQPLHETLEELLTTNQAPVYVVHFTQAAALEQAQALMSDEHVHAAGEGQDRGADRRLPFRLGVRQDPVPAGAARHRRAPRRHAPQVPPPRRDTRPGRPAQGHLRHRHARRRHQRADPHGGVHRAEQVRRQADATAAGPRVPPDRRARGPGRVRHGGPRRRSGARARRRERAVLRSRQAGDDPKARRKVVKKKPPEGFDLLGPAHLRAPRRRPSPSR